MKSFKNYVKNRDLNEMARFNVGSAVGKIDLRQNQSILNLAIELKERINTVLDDEKNKFFNHLPLEHENYHDDLLKKWSTNFENDINHYTGGLENYKDLSNLELLNRMRGLSTFLNNILEGYYSHNDFGIKLFTAKKSDTPQQRYYNEFHRVVAVPLEKTEKILDAISNEMKSKTEPQFEMPNSTQPPKKSSLFGWFK